MTVADGSRNRVSKGTAKTVAVVALLLAAGFIAAGVATAGQAGLLPMALGRLAAEERSLSRSTVTLAVHVAALDEGGEIHGAAGAVVSVGRPGGATELAVETADERGRVVFELERGAYAAAVEYDGMSFVREFALRQDVRVVVVFDEDGDAHVFRHDRRDLARHGELATLYIGVREADEAGNRTPVADATVRVFRVHETDSGGRLEAVAEKETGLRGLVLFRVEPGRYAVEVVTPENHTAAGRVHVSEQAGIRFLFEADGTAHVVTRDGMARDRVSPS